MAAKSTTSCLNFLKRIPKLLAPFLLFAVVGILNPIIKFVYMNPLVEETRHDATELLIISIIIALVTLTLAFAEQVVARLFVASSTTYSGDRFSLAELLREVTKWHNMRVALVTTAAVVAVVQLASMTLLDGDMATAMRDSGLLSVRGSLFLAAFLAIPYMVMSAAVSRKEWSVVVLVTLLLPDLLVPACGVAVLYLYTEQVMGLGLSLLSVYDILQGVQGLLFLSAASVYCYQAKSMEQSKEMVAACDGGKKTS